MEDITNANRGADMDCSQSEIYIMQHFDKKIKPKNAQRLAKHILTCENCRELYLLMDETHETIEAPENFTESVMQAVRKIPVATPKKQDGQLSLRLVWGFSALIIAVGLFVVQDLTHIANMLLPIVESISGVFDFNVAIDGLGFTALLLVAIMSVLLYVLHNQEHVKA